MLPSICAGLNIHVKDQDHLNLRVILVINRFIEKYVLYFTEMTSAPSSSVLFTDYQYMTIDMSNSSVLVLESFVLTGRERVIFGQ